jgi:hypothetical protein
MADEGVSIMNQTTNISKLRSRGQWRSLRVVALLFLGLSSGAVPLRLTTARQSGTKNHYMLPLDLGDDWKTNVTIINREQQQADFILSAYGGDGRFLAGIPTLINLAAEERKSIQPKTIVPAGSETLGLELRDQWQQDFRRVLLHRLGIEHQRSGRLGRTDVRWSTLRFRTDGADRQRIFLVSLRQL